MDRYVSQLIEKLAVAEANPTPATNLGNSYEEFEATMLRIEEEANVSAEHLLNVSYQELPPVDRMNHQQIQNLLEAILNALSAKGTDVSIPGNGVPVEVVYSELRKMF